MKFGKVYSSQMVPEWQPAYMDYNYLKKLLKQILVFQKENTSSSIGVPQKGSLRRTLSLYRSFSGLINLQRHSPQTSVNENFDDEVILVSEGEPHSSERSYETVFLMSSEQGGEYELVFFRRLDDEFNKVLRFYKEKVRDIKNEAEELSKQMDTLIALRIRVHNPLENLNVVHDESSLIPGMKFQGIPHMDMPQEDSKVSGFRQAPLEILDRVKINIDPDTPISTLKNVLNWQNDSSFNKEELRNAEEKLKQAFVEFYQKLRLLKNFSLLNQAAFSKIMKKYDKITSRNASKSYVDMVENSYLGRADEVSRLIEKVETTYIKHFAHGNRSNGMKLLRPRPKKDRHRVSFSLGLFTGCSIALIVAIIVMMRARHLLDDHDSERDQYMENIFPLYSLFGYAILHILMYAGDIYFWRRYRVNYPFIFGIKQGREVGYRQILLLASGLSVLTLAAILSNLDMKMDPRTKTYKTVTELVPLGLVIVVLLVSLCPFNIIYRSSRFFFIQCAWRCICAPFYKVNLPDFLLADQMTSQVQAFRSLLFYICYYGWGGFKKRSNKCQDSNLYQIFHIIVAILPFWARFLQCIRRFFEEKDKMQGINSLKYFSTIIALVIRTLYDQKHGMFWKIMAVITSGLTTIFNTYWDLVLDWGLLRTDGRNRWLRDKLLVPNKAAYFAAMVINIILRLAWMQLVLDFKQTSFIHKKALVAIVASLEIIRRGIWNFFRLENEQLNNVGKYRAYKTVPLPFNYNGDED